MGRVAALVKLSTEVYLLERDKKRGGGDCLMFKTVWRF